MTVSHQAAWKILYLGEQGHLNRTVVDDEDRLVMSDGL